MYAGDEVDNDYFAVGVLQFSNQAGQVVHAEPALVLLPEIYNVASAFDWVLNNQPALQGKFAELLAKRGKELQQAANKIQLANSMPPPFGGKSRLVH